jgi:hypothetical protein
MGSDGRVDSKDEDKVIIVFRESSVGGLEHVLK